MKNVLARNKILRKILIFVGLILIQTVIYMCIYQVIQEKKADRVYTSQNEFLNTVDCAEIFDENPNKTFLISFEIRAKEIGTILVYQQNGSGARYVFGESITVTQDYQLFQLEVMPILADVNEEASYLAFFGGYGTGVIPEVRRITIDVLDK